MSNRINPFKLFIGVFIPNWLLARKDVASGVKVCYGVLCRFAGRNGHCWPAQEALADMMGVSVRQVQRHMQELVELKLIEPVRRGHMRTNVYYFLDHPWIHEETPADDDVPEEPSADDHETTDMSGHETTDMSYRRESREESHSSLRSEEDDTPSARNLNSSGEKVAAWEDFLARLSSRRKEGIQSPIFNPSSYARKCAQNGGGPPDVDLDVLFDVARAVKFGLGRKVVILPALEDLQDTATYFKKCQQAAGEDFLAWLNDTVSVVKITHGSLGDDKLLIHALTQSGKLKRYAEWQAQREQPSKTRTPEPCA